MVRLVGFVRAGAAHALAFAAKKSLEMRANFYTLGSRSVIYMGLHALWVLLV